MQIFRRAEQLVLAQSICNFGAPIGLGSTGKCVAGVDCRMGYLLKPSV